MTINHANTRLFRSWLTPSKDTVNDIVIRDLTPKDILKQHDQFIKLLKDITK